VHSFSAPGALTTEIRQTILHNITAIMVVVAADVMDTDKVECSLRLPRCRESSYVSRKRGFETKGSAAPKSGRTTMSCRGLASVQRPLPPGSFFIIIRFYGWGRFISGWAALP